MCLHYKQTLVFIKDAKLETDKNFEHDNDAVKIIQYKSEYCDETVLMKRESKEKALCIKEAHSLSDQKRFLNEVLVKNNEVYIALKNEKVVGMIAFNEAEVNQLYIHNDFQDRGIGKQLLDIAKNKSKGTLTLFTFDINRKAQRFYEKNGFKIIGRNYENEEKLDDIKYEWKKNNSG